ncbi:MAG: MBL fold metallo-hydrolase [Pseudomonadota bacterium]
MKLTFCGAAGEVTGSCFLVETGEATGSRFLVDCGMFQGGREADRKNAAHFKFDPAKIDFVLLTHAHIDHSGLVPRLVKAGFKGPIYATAASVDLLGVMLRDAAHIHEKEAEWAQRNGENVEPLYTMAEADASLAHLRGVEYEREFSPHPGVRCRMRDAGHILGSAIAEIWVRQGPHSKKLVFSGDLGQPGHPIVRDPTPIEEADVLVVESTYGDRCHKSMPETLAELAHAISDTITRKQGNVIIPAFAVGRTQDIIYLIAELYRQGKIPEVNVYVDSPMAVSATEITLKHSNLLDQETAAMMQWLRHNGGKPHIRFVEDVVDSVALNSVRSGAVIISASGMCDAGRIKYHLKYNVGRAECSVVIAGFQAGGTLGRRLVDGATTVRIFGEEMPVRADIYTIGGLSAHADQHALLDWLSHFRHAPQRTFVVHGEQSVAATFAQQVRQRFGWPVEVPGWYDMCEL